MIRPSVHQRRLGSELRRHRKEAGLTGEQAAIALEVSPSLISRIEAGTRTLRSPDLKELLDAYRLTDGTKRAALLRLAKEAKRQDWFAAYADVLSEPFRYYLGLESEAVTIRSYHPLCVPGQLQTEAYARAVLGSGLLDNASFEKMVSLRMDRQRVLDEEGGPHFVVVMDEPVLRRPIGGVAVLRDQLQHLARMAGRPNVEIRVLPHSQETGVVITQAPFVILGFRETGGDVVFLENATSGFYLEDKSDIDAYDVVFDKLSEVTLEPEASVEMISRIAEELG